MRLDTVAFLLNFTDIPLRAVSAFMALMLLLGLVGSWRQKVADSELGEHLGDHEEARLHLTPLTLTSLAVTALWPFGAFAVMGWFSEFSLDWRRGQRDDVTTPELPREGHLGVSVLQILLLIATGVGVGDGIDRLVWGLGLGEPGVSMADVLGLIGGIWGLQRVTSSASPFLPWVIAMAYHAVFDQLPTLDEAAVAAPQRAPAVAPAPAPAAPPVDTFIDRPEEDDRSARAAAQRLANAAIARELAAIELADRKKAEAEARRKAAEDARLAAEAAAAAEAVEAESDTPEDEVADDAGGDEPTADEPTADEPSASVEAAKATPPSEDAPDPVAAPVIAPMAEDTIDEVDDDETAEETVSQIARMAADGQEDAMDVTAEHVAHKTMEAESLGRALRRQLKEEAVARVEAELSDPTAVTERAPEVTVPDPLPVDEATPGKT